MHKYSSTILSFLIAILCVSCGKNNDKNQMEHHQDEYVSYYVPSGVKVQEVEGAIITGRNYTKEDEYTLNIFELPVGISLDNSQFLAESIGCPWIVETEPVIEEIDGYPVKVYSNVLKGKYNVYITTYAFSNGEKSVILTEAYRGQPGK